MDAEAHLHLKDWHHEHSFEDRITVHSKDGKDLQSWHDNIDEQYFPVKVLLNGSDESRRGHTRQLLIYKALVGNVLDLDLEKQENRTGPDDDHDSVSGGPFTPQIYTPEDFGLK